jgi:hypothetical protein
MPGGDGTGPMGWGPMTGRGVGYCAGYGQPGYMNAMPGRAGWLAGAWARGRGVGRWYYGMGAPGWAPYGQASAYGPYCLLPTKEAQAESLRQQVDWLKQQLEAIDRRLEALGRQS